MAKANSHNNNSNNQTQEPKPDRWYNITLGSSFTDPHPSSKFCSLRYEFKPASVDKSLAGTLHKGKDSQVTVEYHNIQAGRPKVTFQGVSEDYKENDAVLIFDGEGFRLERLHRAVKRLRHVRLPGESAAASAAAGSSPAVEPLPVTAGKGGQGRPPTGKVLGPPVPFQMEQIDVSRIGSVDAELKEEKITESPSVPPNPPSASPDFKPYDSDENVDILDDDDDDDDKQVDEMATADSASDKGLRSGLDIDINKPHQADGDDEIADVDISDDEADRGPNAAEALKAQVNAEVKSEKSSSSSSSSGSESSGSGSGSGSGSSSSDSESSDGDSVISV